MNAYELNDSVYGACLITEPLLIELLTSSAITRLKGIHQAGASYLVRPGRDTSRFDHVVGVMLLIRLLGGSIEEQAAGLIHDVSHTAFSHVIDQVFQRRGEDFHELHFERLIAQSDIPPILQRYCSVPNEVLDVERWSLLEQPMPNMCADRIDYTLRDLLCIGHINQTEIEQFVRALAEYEGQIVTTNVEAAVWFAERYVDEVHDLFMDPLEIYANNQLGQAIKKGLDKAILSEDDLFAQDQDVLEKLQAANDSEITSYLAKLRPGLKVVEDEEHYDLHVYPKGRVIDPLVITAGGDVMPVSGLVPKVKGFHIKIMQRADKGIFVRLV